MDAVLAIRKGPKEPIDLHMVEIMEMKHKTDTDTRWAVGVSDGTDRAMGVSDGADMRWAVGVSDGTDMSTMFSVVPTEDVFKGWAFGGGSDGSALYS